MFERNRKNLLLLEMIIVLFFFSVSVVITLQVFAAAHGTSNENINTSNGLLHLQDWGDQLYASDDPLAFLQGEGWEEEMGAYRYSCQDGIDLSIEVEQLSGEAGTLYKMEMSAYHTNPRGESLLVTSLPLSLYRAAPKGGTP